MLQKRANQSAPTPFSWSMRRREMLNRCPREYFCHYCGSAGGGFLKEGSRESEMLHLARNMVSVEAYVSQLLLRELRNAFNAGFTEKDDFVAEAEACFEKEFRLMLTGKAFCDHKLPLLLELTQAEFTPEMVREKVLRLLREEGAALAAKSLGKLLKTAPEKRLELPFPLKISWNELDCWCTPVAVYWESGTFCALCAGAESEENCALLSFFALEQFRVSPDRVKLFYLDRGDVREGRPVVSFSAPFRRIREDVELMKLLELKSAGRRKECFPQAIEHCSRCRFYNYCSQEP